MNRLWSIAISHSQSIPSLTSPHINMKIAVSILLLVNSALGMPTSFLQPSYLPVYRQNSVLRRQSQTPIVGNLTNDQAQVGYQAVCNSLNVQADATINEMNDVTKNAIAIQVFWFWFSVLQNTFKLALFRPSSVILGPNLLSSTAKT